MTNSWSASSRHYTEAEAAAELGLELDELRALAREHLLLSDEEAAGLPHTLYQRSDLLLLRLLAQQRHMQAAVAVIS